MKSLVRKSLAALMCLSLLMPIAAAKLNAEEPDAEATGESATNSSDLVFLYSSDIRGKLEVYPRMKALKDRLSAEGHAVLTFDAGNSIQGDPRLSLHNGETAFEMMRVAAYDVICPNSLELDFGAEKLLPFAEANQLSLVACNLMDGTGKALFTPYVMKELAGEKVAIIGLVDPATRTKANPVKTKSLRILSGEEMYEACRQAVADSRDKGASRVILLSNLGLNERLNPNRLSDVLENVSGIDLAIDAVSDSSESEIASVIESEHIGDTLVLTMASDENSIGEVTIHTDSTVEHQKFSIDEINEIDSSVQQRVDEIDAETNTQYGAVIGNSQVELFGNSAKTAPFTETLAGQLITDAMRWKFKQVGQDSDLALLNSSAICASIAAGEVSKRDIKALLPYSNKAVLLEVQGSALLEALEAATVDAEAFPQISGVKFNFNASIPYDAGDFYENSSYRKPVSIQRVSDVVIEPSQAGAPTLAINPDETYRLVTTNYLANGALSYHSFRTATVVQELDISLDEIFSEYIVTEIGAALASADQADFTLTTQTGAPVVAQQPPAGQGGNYNNYNAAPTNDPLSTYTHVCYRCKLTKKESEESIQAPAPTPTPAEENESISPPLEPSSDPEPAPPQPPEPPEPPVDPAADSESNQTP